MNFCAKKFTNCLQFLKSCRGGRSRHGKENLSGTGGKPLGGHIQFKGEGESRTHSGDQSTVNIRRSAPMKQSLAISKGWLYATTKRSHLLLYGVGYLS